MTPPDRTPARSLHLWEFQVVRDLLILGGLVFAVWLGARLSVVSLPLLVALGLAYLCEPLVRRIAAALPWLGRTGAVIVMLTTTVAALSVVAVLAVPPIARQAKELIGNAGGYATRAQAFLVDEQRPAWLREVAVTVLPGLAAPSADAKSAPASAGAASGANPPAPAPSAATGPTPDSEEARVRALVRDEMGRQGGPAADGGDLVMRVAHAGNAVLGTVGGIVGGVFGAGLFLIIAVFAFFAFSVQFPAVARSLKSLIPVRHQDRANQLLERMDRIVSSFVRGRLITAGLLGVIYAIGWTLCGVPYALVLGLATGFVSLVPYAAAIGLPIAWILLALSAVAADGPGFYAVADPASGKLAVVWWKVLLFPALVNAIAQILEDYVLNPLIQGKATDLHPVVIMIAIIAGGSLAGLYGMILAVPAVACARVLVDEVVMPRIRSWTQDAPAG